MTPLRAIYAFATALCLAAGAIVVWPAAPYALPARAPDAVPVAAPDLSGAAALFDRAALPAPAPPEEPVGDALPPPDPAAPLRRYEYLGMAASDGRAAGVFSLSGATAVLRPGEELEGFRLLELDARRAVFNLNGARVALSLASTDD